MYRICTGLIAMITHIVAKTTARGGCYATSNYISQLTDGGDELCQFNRVIDGIYVAGW